MRQQSPIPRYVIHDSRWGHQIPDHARYAEETEEADKHFVEETVAQLREEGELHLEVGQFSWNGPPYYAVFMTKEEQECLAADQQGTTVSEADVALKLSWGRVMQLPGYADGQLTRRAAVEQARANFDDFMAVEAGVPTLS